MPPVQLSLLDPNAYTAPSQPEVLFDENGVEETALDRYRRKQKSPLETGLTQRRYM